MATLTLHPVPSRAPRRAVPARGPARRPAADGVPRPAVAPLRLTARGRFVVRAAVLLLGVVATLGVVLAGGRVAQAGQGGRPLTVEYHVVRPGETLWQIAGEAVPGVDRRATVARIVELNALASSGVSAGQRIAVPVAP